ERPEPAVQAIYQKHGFNARSFQEKEILERYRIIDQVVRTSRHERPDNGSRNITRKIDSVVMHPTWGLMVFLGIMFCMFQAVFAWSSYPMLWIETGFARMGSIINHIMPSGVLSDLLVRGVLAGLGGVMVFLPQIIVLFAFIALLEDIGYMARAGFLMDRI